MNTVQFLCANLSAKNLRRAETVSPGFENLLAVIRTRNEFSETEICLLVLLHERTGLSKNTEL